MVHAPPRGIYGTGHYLCHIGVTLVDSKTVLGWLPPELELVSNPFTQQGFHPVNLLFGKERAVHLHPFPIPRIVYSEFAVVVPYTQWKSDSYQYKGPFLFTPLLYLDNWAGIEAGRLLYGFPKKRAKFNITENLYEVIEAESNQSVIRCDIESKDQPMSPESIGNIKRLLQQPSLSQKQDGTYVGSGFYWGIDKAKIIAEKAKVNFNNWWMPTLPSRESRHEILDGVDDFSKGGFYHIDTQWDLTMPMDPDQNWAPYHFDGGQKK